MLDDCSRDALGLEARADEAAGGVTARLHRHPPPLWPAPGDAGRQRRALGACGERALTALEVWLIQLGVRLYHGRPRHPQTQGQEERCHRTLLAECVGRRRLRDLADGQRAFEAWRRVDNHERPHQALGLDVPARRRYRPSARAFP